MCDNKLNTALQTSIFWVGSLIYDFGTDCKNI